MTPFDQSTRKVQMHAMSPSSMSRGTCNPFPPVSTPLPNEVVETDTINSFKNRLDKHWINQEVLFIITQIKPELEVYQFVSECTIFKIQA